MPIQYILVLFSGDFWNEIMVLVRICNFKIRNYEENYIYIPKIVWSSVHLQKERQPAFRII